MTEYDFWKLAWEYQWATDEEMQEAVNLGLITEDQRRKIVSE